MSALRVFGRLSSINVQKVLWTLDEIGLAYEHVPAGGDHGGLDTPQFRALNPHGLVPVIDDAGTVVWESNAIVRYLAAAYDAGGLWPADARARALADRWMDWAATTLQPQVSGHFWAWCRTPAGERDEPRCRALWEAAAESWRKLETHLAGQPYLAGQRLTMADIPAGVLAFRYLRLELPRPALPGLEAWAGRLAERPAYARNVMRPFDELFGRLAF